MVIQFHAISEPALKIAPKAKAYAAMGGAAMPLAAPVPVPMAKAVAAEGEGTEVWVSCASFSGRFFTRPRN